MNQVSRALSLPIAALPLLWAGAAYPGTFSVKEVFDPDTGNTEHRFFHDGFHFSTLIEDPDGRLIFRSHPDQKDVNGFGSSWVMNPFLAGAEPGLGIINSIETSVSGIQISLSGQVARAFGLTYGTWTISADISYDAAAAVVAASGTLAIALDGTLAAAAADLNVERITSNYLFCVPLQTGGIGNTGDMQHAVVTYAPGGGPMDFVWIPQDMPSHFPTDSSTYLDIEVVGQLNTVDTMALGEGFQIAVARKPTVRLTYNSAPDAMIAGLIWDEGEGQNFAADNVGINHLFLQGQTSSTSFTLPFTYESRVFQGSPPVGECCPWDCQATPDGNVGITDFLSLLAQWGEIGTACDVDGSGVGITDFLELLANWGPCP